MTIKTERLILNSLKTSEIKLIHKHFKADDNFEIYSGMECKDENILKIDFTHSYLYSIYLKENNEMIGYIGLNNRDNWYIEFYIFKEYRRNGYCIEVINQIADLCFTGELLFERKTINEIWAITLSKNIPAINLLEKCGFKYEGYPIFLFEDKRDRQLLHYYYRLENHIEL